jgi:hypothetical protein
MSAQAARLAFYGTVKAFTGNVKRKSVEELKRL